MRNLEFGDFAGEFIEKRPNQTEEGPDFDKISDTARFTAHARTFDNINYADLISQLFSTEDIFNEWGKDNLKLAEGFAPLFESRFKTINQALEDFGNKQVVELASGLSSRCIDLIEDGVRCIETDLSEIIAEKKKFLGDRFPEHSGDFLDIDITKSVDFQRLNELLDDTPVSIVSEEGAVSFTSEGVLLYLNKEETEAVAKNIKEILSQRGGVWITDIVTKDSMRSFLENSSEEVKKLVGKVSGITERNLENNPFENNEEARSFFETLGFKITEYKHVDQIDNLSSVSKLGLDKDVVTERLSKRIVWALEVQ